MDHRGEVYVPELGEKFIASQKFRIIATQNPRGNGDGRKGLPQSFQSRFTRIVFEPYTHKDLVHIAYSTSIGSLPRSVIEKLVSTVNLLQVCKLLDFFLCEGLLQ